MDEGQFTREEVRLAVKHMKPTVALGPDGLPALFYHRYWFVIEDDIAGVVLVVLNDGEIPNVLMIHLFV